MKKYLLTFALGGLLLTAGLTSCLKDKGYDNGQYGVNGAPAKAVSIPQSTSSPVAYSINASAAVQSLDAPTVNLEAPTVASEDVTVTLVVDQSLLPNGITPLPPTAYNIPSLTLVIPAGERTATAKINIPDATVLNPNNKYGVGFKIASVTPAGYTIASNMKSVVISFSIKNKYDGVYNLKGYHNRVPYNFPYNTEMHMVTTGPSSVVFYWPDAGSIGHPIGVGPNNQLSWYGTDISPEVVFDPATNLVTSVFNQSAAVGITMFTGAGSGTSRFDENANPKMMYVYFNYGGNPLRAFFDTLTYTGPRP